MKFTKMHGIGNDYVYVNSMAETVDDPARLAREISDRHFGVGADGLILVLPSESADVRMRMFNADGSEAEMCGNGIRCLAKYAYEHGISRSNPMRVQTARGVLSLALQVEGEKVSGATVNMGRPILKLAEIPVDESKVSAADKPHRYSFDIEGETISPATFISMGNPHVVIFVNDLKNVDPSRLGPPVERHPAFPRRINVHWVHVKSPTEITMKTWERGSGVTLACGTGACAVCVAGALTGRTNRAVLAHLPGGDLSLEWRESDDCVYMAGPATEIFSGDWPVKSDHSGAGRS